MPLRRPEDSPSDLTPLQLAILGDHEDISKLLIAKGADVNAVDNIGITILDEATRKGNAGIINYDTDLRVPTWVAYRLREDDIDEPRERTECFRPDPRVEKVA